MVISLLLIAAIRGISGVGNLDGRKFIGRTSGFPPGIPVSSYIQTARISVQTRDICIACFWNTLKQTKDNVSATRKQRYRRVSNSSLYLFSYVNSKCKCRQPSYLVNIFNWYVELKQKYDSLTWPELIVHTSRTGS